MANTYSQIYIQLIFAVKSRQSLIKESYNAELFKIIGSIINNKSCRLLEINSVPDHIHILISMSPKITISDIVGDVKSITSKILNEKYFFGKFKWQSGFGAFSYAKSQIENVRKYIRNQKKHHKKITFREEYIDFLTKFEIEYDQKYLFDWISDD